jgi:hypothetical protein
MAVPHGRSTWSLDVLSEECSDSRKRGAAVCGVCRAEQKRCGSGRPFGALSRQLCSAEIYGLGARPRGPAPIAGQGAPARVPSLCAAGNDGDVTLGRGHGIILVERERALSESAVASVTARSTRLARSSRLR